MKTTCALAWFLLIWAISCHLHATYYYVNGTTGNDAWDGRAIEWDGVHGPKKTIQGGVNASSTGDVVSVAPGTYSGTGNRDINFGGRGILLRSYGSASTTIIDCGNATRFCSLNAPESGVVIDGFTITNGYSSLSGGAIYCAGSTPTIRYCVFVNNSCAHYGGAIYCWSASPTLIGCEIRDNSCGLTGGGMACYGNSGASLIDCVIADNWSGDDGGGILCGDSTVTITGCEIRGNTAADLGGGIYCYGGPPAIRQCIINDNEAFYSGGGIYCDWSDPLIENCVIARNVGTFYGGGIECYNGSDPTIRNCTIADNFAFNSGGGLECGGTPSLANCVFWGNWPDQVYEYSGWATLVYCNIEGGWTGNGYANRNADPLFVLREYGDFRLRPGSPCIDAGTSSGTPAEDLLGRPRHNDPTTGNTGGGPIIYYDIGAYEFKGYYVNDDIGTDYDNGLYPTDMGGSNGPKKTIQGGVDAADDGDTVVVAAGTYPGIEAGNRDIDFGGKAIVLLSADGPDNTIIDPDYYSGAFYLDSRESYDTVIDGFTIRHGMSTYYGGMYCYYYVSPTIMNCKFVENQSLQGGGGISLHAHCSPRILYCEFDRNIAQWNGGAIQCDYYCSPEIIDCVFKDNSVTNYGGAIACQFDSNPVISNSSLFGNSVTGLRNNLGGGAISCSFNSNAEISGCRIRNNSADNSLGGGIRCFDSDVDILNCLITGNDAGHGGGGVSWSSSNSMMVNCLVTGNNAGVYGGGLYCFSSNMSITNCTIADNTSGGLAGGVWTWDAWGNGPTFTNCILWGDTPQEIDGHKAAIRFDYCDIEGGWSGAGSYNISANPLFVRSGYRGAHDIWHDGDYHLRWDSPCVDTGTNTPPNLPSTDLDGYPRRQYGRTSNTVDRGAYEFGSYIPIWSIVRSGPNVQVTWCSSGLGGKFYDVLYCYQDITDPKNWYVMQYSVPSTGALTTYTDTSVPASGYRFYQIVEH